MDILFEVINKSGRKIRLTKKQWSHIRQNHAEVEYPEEIKETLENPDNVINDVRENVNNFYKYFKHKKHTSKFLKVIVRYLNGEGFIISAHFVRTIS